MKPPTQVAAEPNHGAAQSPGSPGFSRLFRALGSIPASAPLSHPTNATET